MEEKDLDRENLQLSSVKKRFLALVLDELIFIVLIFLSIVVGQETQTNPANFDTAYVEMVEKIAKMATLLNIVIVAYETLFVYLYGATPGKIWQRIYIIKTQDFSRLSFFDALVRAISKQLNRYIFYFGFFLVFVGEFRQTLQDRIAKTIVVDA